MGIDPGIVNLGWAILEVSTGKRIRGGTHAISEFQYQVQGNDSLIASLLAKFFDQFPFMDFVCVEQNRKLFMMEIVGSMCMGYWAARGASVFHSAPVTIKSYFSNLGKRKAARRTKEDAISEANSLGYEAEDNHEYDAIMLARWAIEVKIPSKS